MNIELNNATENEVEYAEKESDYTQKRFEKIKIFIFLGCLIFAFLVWCYAHYLEDPIIIKEVDIRCLWVDNTRGVQVVMTDSDGNEIDTISVYGEKSVLNSINFIEVELQKLDFENSDSKVITIQLPDDVHSHTSKIIVKVIDNTK